MAAMLASAPRAQAAVYTVTSRADNSSTGTLRAAIHSANANPGTTIQFQFTGSAVDGVFTIQPTSLLPVITGQGTVIDGATQTTFGNTNPNGPEVQIDFSQDGAFLSDGGLQINASNCTIRGLILNKFAESAVLIQGTNNGNGQLTATSNNKVQGCYIGTGADGSAVARYAQSDGSLWGGRYGVRILVSDSNTIGGTTLAARNVIAGAGTYIDSQGKSSTFGPGMGVSVDGTSNSIQGNYIGTDAKGVSALANAWGIFIAAGKSNLIGGSISGARNLISGNIIQGISLSSSTTPGTQVLGNYIGTDFNGTKAIPNRFGINITESGGNIIGGATSGERNVISGNSFFGIHLSNTANDPNTILNTIQGNYIGADASGFRSLPNLMGIVISGHSNNLIGGAGSSSANRIAFNSIRGVSVENGTLQNLNTGETTTTVPSGNTIRGNAIYSNGVPGLDLSGGTQDSNHVTANDLGDGDAGPNGLQNYPVLSAATVSRGITTIQGTLNSTPNSSFRLEFFRNSVLDASGHGQGENFLGGTDATTDGAGNAAWSFAVSGSFTGQFLTATATKTTTGDTSEFSKAVAAQDAVNRAPVASAQSVTTSEDTAKSFSLAATDADGDALSYTLVTLPTQGILNGTAPNFTYRPRADFNGSDSFSFKANDGLTDSNIATVSFAVSPVNDAPSFVPGADQSANDAVGPQIVEGWAKSLSAGPGDEAGQKLDFLVSNSNPALFSAQPSISASGSLSYTPALPANGSAQVSVALHDDGGTLTGGADTSLTRTFSITLSHLNRAPVGEGQNLTTRRNLALSGQLSAKDEDKDALTYRVATGPTHGSVEVLPDGRFTYTPNPAYTGSDAFTFGVSDGASDSEPSTVSILVLEPSSTIVSTLADVVNNTDGQTSLREALAGAEDGATISFHPELKGEINLNGAELRIGKSLNLSGNGNALTVSGAGNSRVFHIESGTVFISGLTISKGNAPEGGGILNSGTLVLSNPSCHLCKCTVVS